MQVADRQKKPHRVSYFSETWEILILRVHHARETVSQMSLFAETLAFANVCNKNQLGIPFVCGLLQTLCSFNS